MLLYYLMHCRVGLKLLLLDKNAIRTFNLSSISWSYSTVVGKLKIWQRKLIELASEYTEP